MTDIVYTYGNQAYLNITNACPCRCTFCIRNNGDSVGEATTLWFDHNPTIDEIKGEIDKFDFTKYNNSIIIMNTTLICKQFLSSCPIIRIFAFFVSRKAEISDFSTELEIFAVSKGGKVCAVKVKLSLSVDQRLVNVNRNYIGKEHMVRAKLDDVGDSALKRERTFCDKRAGDLACLFLVKIAFFKLVHLRARVDTAKVGGLYELCRGEIYRELAALAY